MQFWQMLSKKIVVPPAKPILYVKLRDLDVSNEMSDIQQVILI